MAAALAPSERRRYRRVQAPILCRPIAQPWLPFMANVQDVSLGGLRTLTDDFHRVGDRLELELQMPGGEQLTLEVEVVWADELAPGSEAKFEVGLRFTKLSPEWWSKLQPLLDG